MDDVHDRYMTLVCVGGPAAGERCEIDISRRREIEVRTLSKLAEWVPWRPDMPMAITASARADVYVVEMIRVNDHTVYFLRHHSMTPYVALTELIAGYRSNAHV